MSKLRSRDTQKKQKNNEKELTQAETTKDDGFKFDRVFMIFFFALFFLLLWYSNFLPSITSREKSEYLATAEFTHYSFDVLEKLPHNPTCFTEGLEYYKHNILMETCGLYDKSLLYIGGGVAYTFPNKYFAEGLTVIPPNRLAMLTYKEKQIFVVNADDATLMEKHFYPFDGWGLAYDHEKSVVYATNGSCFLMTLDKNDFSVLRTCRVVLSEKIEVSMLNELEFVDGHVYANIFMSVQPPDYPFFVVSIDPVPRKSALSDEELCFVNAKISLNDIYRPQGDIRDEVINGIAKVPGKKDELLITGKLWTTMFRGKLKKTRQAPLPKSLTQNDLIKFLSTP